MQKHSIPTVGSKVRVITCRPNYYIYTYKQEPFVYREYSGTVLRPEKFNKLGEFNMTGEGRMRMRTISLRDVHEMELLEGSFESKQNNDIRAFHVGNEKRYTVTVQGTKYNCTCTGFVYRKTCKHVKAIQSFLEVKS